MNTEKSLLRVGSQSSNLADVIHGFLAELRVNWNPKTETKTGYGYHGSSKDDEIQYTLYFDSYRCEWTTKDRAFQGFVFQEINKLLK